MVAVGRGGFFHCVDFREILQNSSPQKPLVNFEIISQAYSLGDPFRNCSRNFDLPKNMAAMGEDFLHYTDMKKFFKNLFVWNPYFCP